MANARPLSASPGTTPSGYPVLLDDSSVPGKAVHVNNGSTADMLTTLLVNLNPATVSVFFVIQGPGVPEALGREAMDRIDVPAGPTGTVTLPEASSVLGQGCTLHISADTPPGGAPVLLYGRAEAQTADTPLESPQGYGGLETITAEPMSDVASGVWQTVPMQLPLVASPVGIVQDAPNNRFQITREGLWLTSFYCMVSHNEVNSSRRLEFRVYNETLGIPVPGDEYLAFSGRNMAGSNIAITSMFEVTSSLVDHWFRLEMSGDSAFATVVMERAGIDVVRLDDL